MKSGYKVVHEQIIDGERQWVSATKALGEKQVVYKEGEAVSPPADQGPLAVFEEVRHARWFVNQFDPHLTIFLCEYEPSEAQALWCHFSWMGARTIMQLQECPPGTVLAASVTLLYRTRG